MKEIFESQVPASDFTLKDGRRLLTDAGEPDLPHASTSEAIMREIAHVLYERGGRLNRSQLTQVEQWVALIKERSIYD